MAIYLKDKLEKLNANELKKVAGAWLGRGYSTRRKDDVLEALHTLFKDPKAFQEATQNLPETGKLALSLIRLHHGRISRKMLATQLERFNPSLPPRRRYLDDPVIQMIGNLQNQGILLSDNYSSYYGYSSYGHHDTRIEADTAVLAYIEPFTLPPLELPTIERPTASWQRQPAAVALEVNGLLTAIREIQPLKRKQDGALYANEVKKLDKALTKAKSPALNAELALSESSRFYQELFEKAGLLQVAHVNLLQLSPQANNFAQSSYDEQVRQLYQAYSFLSDWQETKGMYRWERANYLAIRQLLLQSLMEMARRPEVATQSFVTFGALGRHMAQQAAHRISTTHIQAARIDYRATPLEAQKAHEQWRKEQVEAWPQKEMAWITAALCGPLYHLGLVAIGQQGNSPDCFHLTPLGVAILNPEAEVSLAPETANDDSPWIIQPTSEILAYLDRTAPEQLAFLERHTERVSVQSHMATYRLTGPALYQALEAGSSLAETIQKLETYSGRPLPQNVQRNLEEWSAKRDSLAVHCHTNLMEFDTAADRDEALTKGIAGIAIGGRFILMKAAGHKLPAYNPWLRQSVDYTQPPTRCLEVDEDGRIQFDKDKADFFIDYELSQYAELVNKESNPQLWRLTAVTVTANFNTAEAIVDWLRQRVTHTLPDLLVETIHGWHGRSSRITVAPVTVLHCNNRNTFNAISQSPGLAPLITGVMAPNLLLVEAGQEKALQQALAARGLKLFENPKTLLK